MKKMIALLLTLAMLQLAIACTSSKSSGNIASPNEMESANDPTSSTEAPGTSSPAASPSNELLVTLESSINITDMQTVTASGNTNLPDGTILMLNLANESDYAVQSEVSVRNGAFSSGTFSNLGEYLDRGTYTLVVTTKDANLQPATVKDLIGENGANLTGEFVKTDAAKKTASISKTFEIDYSDQVLDTLETKLKIMIASGFPPIKENYTPPEEPSQTDEDDNILELTAVEGKADGDYMHVTGAVKNNSQNKYTFIRVKVVYKNSNGDIVDTDWTYAVGDEGLEPGEQKYFEIMTKKRTGMEKFAVSIIDYK